MINLRYVLEYNQDRFKILKNILQKYRNNMKLPMKAEEYLIEVLLIQEILNTKPQIK